MTVSPEAVRAAVLERIGGENGAVLADDYDLLAEGAVDSFGLLELIGVLEERFGVQVDFNEADGDTMTQIGELSRLVAASAAPAALVSADDGGAATPPTRLELRAPALPRRLVGRAAVGGYRSWVRVRDKLFSLASAGGYASFGSNSVIQLPVRVHGASRIAVGSGVFVGANSWLQVLSGGEGPAITIGDGAAIAGHCVLSATESITIGSNVSLARNVYIADHTHAYTEADRPVLAQGLAGISGVEIGDGAWLGENVTVLPGVRIGCGAVVGANSVVGSDIPDYALALGAPARVVRRFGAAPDA